jgi:serine/threonine protein kinase
MKIKETTEQTETLISKDGKKLTENDFEVIRMLGKGAFGKVILTRKKDDGELYAIKILNKSDLIKKD